MLARYGRNLISSSIDPTPQAMPNMVRNERTLLAAIARKTCPKVSPMFCMPPDGSYDKTLKEVPAIHLDEAGSE
jgi:hypothetical protein